MTPEPKHRRTGTWGPKGRVAGGACAALLCLGLLAGAARPARAADYPTIQPQHEVTVSYDLDSSETGPMRLRLQASPSLEVTRIDFGGEGDYLLLDRAQDRVQLVSPHKGLVFVVPADGFLRRDLGPGSGLRFQRDGHRRIAGIGCTFWRVEGPDGVGDACVTQDGVVLEGEGHGTRPGDQGQVPAGHLIATGLLYGPLSPALFAPPAGLQEVELPQALFRAMVPGLSGLPLP